MRGSNRGGKRQTREAPVEYSTNVVQSESASVNGADAGLDLRKAAVAYSLRGWSNQQIADALNIHPSTVSHWRAQPSWAPLADAAVAMLVKQPVEAFYPHIEPAMSTYAHALANKDTSVARDVLDRVFGKPGLAAGNAAGVQVNVQLILGGGEVRVTYDSRKDAGDDVVDGEASEVEGGSGGGSAPSG